MALHWITPTLFLGRPSGLSGTVEVTRPDEAIRVIDSGRVACLPEDAWDTARAVLTALGLPRDEVNARLSFAEHGQPTPPRFVYRVLTGNAARDHAELVRGTRGRTAASFSRHDVHRLHDVVSQGGFTVQPTDRSVPTHGFSVSLHPDLGGVAAVHHISRITPRDLAEHRRAGRELFQHGWRGNKIYQGAWHDTQTGDVYLDTSHITDDEAHARDFALQHRQLAYYDLGKGHSVYFDPTRDEDYHAGKPEAIQKYADIADRFGEVTPERYRGYEHDYDPHPYAAEHEQAEQQRAIAARAGMRIRSLWPL